MQGGFVLILQIHDKYTPSKSLNSGTLMNKLINNYKQEFKGLNIKITEL